MGFPKDLSNSRIIPSLVFLVFYGMWVLLYVFTTLFNGMESEGKTVPCPVLLVTRSWIKGWV